MVVNVPRKRPQHEVGVARCVHRLQKAGVKALYGHTDRLNTALGLLPGQPGTAAQELGDFVQLVHGFVLHRLDLQAVLEHPLKLALPVP